MKRAILLRHASARDAPHDSQRELTAQGVDEAARAGAKIAALGAAWAPTLALCSTALRATSTLANVRPALTALASSELDARLYLASAGDLLAALQRAPEAEACVLVIAHEPGISALVRRLARGADPGAGLVRGMAPASFAALALDVRRWEEACPACAEIAAYERP